MVRNDCRASLSAPLKERISPAALAKREGVSLQTVYRWIRKGSAGVQLQAFYIGGQIYTTDAFFREWTAEVQRRRMAPMPERDPVARAFAAMESL